MHLLQTISVTLVCMFLPLAMNADDSIPPKKGLVRVLYEFVKEFNVMLNKMDILINDEVNEIRFITFKSLVINDML